ncbi:hypothetical protein [Spirilliplanes yamanashiensis]|uniref:Uncharacterized protein n=1 Tax=Spirilliplanes yamanashiensis TaxID=42233 RepID=A0A8J3Y4G7_9ACTN|nr:hypothetical protein [Spirilliplanes yamanashiensis]MDP9819604.1 hypothetical protein [Spirilliplanes yamanashiensis]GIJ01576.1 hypothetical protein Sya03_09280 [Spirilliplanes yamanashiensis]
MPAALLHVASDTTVTVVSRHRLRTTGGRVTRRRWPAVLETTSTVPEAAAPHSLWAAAIITLGPVATAFGLALTGTPWPLSAAAAAIVFTTATWYLLVHRRRLPPAQDAAAAITLTEHRERAAFAKALTHADEISASWPALTPLIDVPHVERLLAEFLWHLAGILSAREDARRSATAFMLTTPASADPDPKSRRAAVTRRLSALDADVARRLTALSGAAEAGRIYSHRRNFDRTTRSVTPDRPEGRPEAVLAAYRALATAHGDTRADPIHN